MDPGDRCDAPPACGGKGWFRSWSLGCAAVALSVALVSAAAAQKADAPAATRRAGAAGASASGLSLERNALSDEGSACRLTFVSGNATGQGIERAVFEAAVFTPWGAAARLTLFDFGGLPAGRPRARQLDLEGLSCGAAGRVLVDGAQTREGQGVPEGACA